jgi:hypothetical protein
MEMATPKLNNQNDIKEISSLNNSKKRTSKNKELVFTEKRKKN